MLPVFADSGARAVTDSSCQHRVWESISLPPALRHQHSTRFSVLELSLPPCLFNVFLSTECQEIWKKLSFFVCLSAKQNQYPRQYQTQPKPGILSHILHSSTDLHCAVRFGECPKLVAQTLGSILELLVKGFTCCLRSYCIVTVVRLRP